MLISNLTEYQKAGVAMSTKEGDTQEFVLDADF